LPNQALKKIKTAGKILFEMKKEKNKPAKKTKIRFYLAALLVVITALPFIYTYRQQIESLFTNTKRDIEVQRLSRKDWANRIELPGLPNFHKVSDELYRGAQPTKQGIEQLKKLGIKTIINLRSFHSDRDEIADSNLLYEHIYIKPWHLEDKDTIRFLQIVSDESNHPVFVHCRRGADRTGSMCAIYRIIVQGWSKQRAIEEMTKGGFGFNKIYINLIKYIEQLDTEKIKQSALTPTITD